MKEVIVNKAMLSLASRTEVHEVPARTDAEDELPGPVF
jgi:hypothetical protein